jgi:hypothetical protein
MRLDGADGSSGALSKTTLRRRHPVAPAQHTKPVAGPPVCAAACPYGSPVGGVAIGASAGGADAGGADAAAGARAVAVAEGDGRGDGRDVALATGRGGGVGREVGRGDGVAAGEA